MSRARAAFGVGVAAFCGIATAYATWQPEFEKLSAERDGNFQKQHEHEGQNDRVISQAIMSDLKEAKQIVEPEGEKGIAWGLREAIWGPPKNRQTAQAGEDIVSEEDRKQQSER